VKSIDTSLSRSSDLDSEVSRPLFLKSCDVLRSLRDIPCRKVNQGQENSSKWAEESVQSSVTPIMLASLNLLSSADCRMSSSLVILHSYASSSIIMKSPEQRRFANIWVNDSVLGVCFMVVMGNIKTDIDSKHQDQFKNFC